MGIRTLATRTIAMMTLLLVSTARADDPSDKPDVQLFGGIRWDSGIADIVAKVNKLSPTTMTVGLNQYQYASDMKGLTDPAAINRELEALARKPLVKPTEIARKGALAQFGVFKDDKGKEWHMPKIGMQVKATGIVIAGVVYDLSIQTFNSLGVVELTPKNVVYGKGEPTVALPIGITSMKLKAVSGSAAQKHDVFEAMRKKYPAMTEGYENGADLQGDDGIVSFMASEISYRRQRDSERRYEKAASAYVTKQGAAGKTDQSNSL